MRDGKYTEKHYGDTYDLSKKREDRKTPNENENAEDNATRDTSVENEATNDDVFYDLTQTPNISPAQSINNTSYITKNFEISSEHNRVTNNHAMKNIEEIVQSISKSYHVSMCTY